MRMFLILFLASLCSFGSWGQSAKTPILDRKIDVSFKNERITVVLARIGQLAGFSFSYNSSIIPADEVVTVSMKNATVREILNEVFKGSMSYKDKGNHLILTRVSVKQPKANVTSMIISGYVEDWFTNEKIIDASVYDKSTLTSAVTDEFGFFRLRLEKRSEENLAITISKRDYIDTTIVISEPANQYFHVSLKRTRPVSSVDTTKTNQVIVVTSDSTAIDSVATDPEMDREEVPLPYSSSPNVENIRDTLYRDIQVSILPFVGTNGPMSGNIINNYSINFFGGYAMGTRQIELGFFFNIDRSDVSFLQIAGFGNMVGGNVTGAQLSGFFNVNGGETKAVQASGFTNINLDEFQGVQAAGMANINLRSADGVKAAGMLNYSNGNSSGVEVAGMANVHGGDFRGPQIAGFLNVNSGKLRGSQISSFLNYGRTVYGTQIGFLNVADTLTGVPIGFLSIVKQGYHQLEISADEIFYTNIAFRSGVRQFYNIISASIQPQNIDKGAENVWSLGYGLGTARRLTKWWHVNIDLTSQHVNKGGFTTELSSLNKLNVGFDFKIAKGFSIYAGGTLNAYLTNSTYTDYPTLFTDFTPKVFYDDRPGRGDTNWKMWFGGKVALRFF